MDEDLRNLFNGNNEEIDELIDMLKKAKKSGAKVEIKTSTNPFEIIKDIIRARMPESAKKIEKHFSDQCREFIEKTVTKKRLNQFTEHLQGMETDEKIRACIYSFVLTFLEQQLSKGRIILKSEKE